MNGGPRDVWISIRGVQNIDGESAVIELDTAGTMERTADGYRLMYDESAATGMEGVTSLLSIGPEMVTLERRGAMNSLLVLEKGRRTLCNYDTGCGSLTMGVYAREIRSALREQGGEADFHYTLNYNNGVASAHDIYVRVTQTPPN